MVGMFYITVSYKIYPIFSLNYRIIPYQYINTVRYTLTFWPLPPQKLSYFEPVFLHHQALESNISAMDLLIDIRRSVLWSIILIQTCCGGELQGSVRGYISSG